MQVASTNADGKMRLAILAALAADDRTASASLRVGVLNGIAHLAGVVDSLDIRSAAEELARQTPGLRGVANRIEAPGAPSPAREINLNPKTDLRSSSSRSTSDDKNPQ